MTKNANRKNENKAQLSDRTVRDFVIRFVK